MATELATGYVSILPSAKGFRRALDNELGGDFDKVGGRLGDDTSRGFGSKFTSGIKAVGKAGALAFGAAFAGAVVLGKSSIDAASGLEEAQTKVNVVFGDGAGAITEWAKTANKSIGQSQRQALEAAGTYGNLFQAFGVGQKPAQEMSTTLVQLASDLASFNNTSVDEALVALQSGLSGETEPLKRYGVAINQTRLEAEALRLGLVGSTVDQAKFSTAQEAADKATRKVAAALKEHGKGSQEYRDAVRDQEQAEAALGKVLEGKVEPMNEAAKSQAAYSLIMQDTTLAQGDFERTSDGLANQQRILAARFEDAKASIGQALLPAMTSVVSFIADKVIPKVQELAEEWMPKLRAGFEAVVSWVRANWPQMRDTIVTVFDAIVAGVTWVVKWFQDNWPTIRQVVANVFDFLKRTWENVLKPTFDAIVAAAQWVVAWIRDNWPEISQRISGVMEQVSEIISATAAIIEGIIKTVTATVMFIWNNFGDDIVKAIQIAWDLVSGIVQTAIDVVHGIIKTVTALIRGDWDDVWNGIKDIVDGVWGGIKKIVNTAIDSVKLTLATAWDTIKVAADTAWNLVKSTIMTPVNAAKDAIIGAFQEAVNRVKSIWNGLEAVVNFFDTYIKDPITKAVNTLKTAVGNAFENAVSAVETAWNTLKSVVKAPINVVIGFYNNGIRGIWNNVISKIPGVGDLPSVAMLNSGGRVPGSGNRDTVPAMLTPGEFVITKKAAAKWGAGALEMFNKGPNGTVDPAIFGYAAGGYVKSPEEVLEWARQQAGKPYAPEFGHGPDRYDCSGFTSAIANIALGKPLSRRHSSGTIGSDPAFAPGLGENYPDGFAVGTKPPYARNSLGAFVGHIAGTLAGVNVESTPPAVRVGGAARGATNPMFGSYYHLPGFGGLSESDKQIAAQILAVKDMSLSGGQPPLGDLLEKLINRLPGMVYGFLSGALPDLMKKAVETGIQSSPLSVLSKLNPFADGGMVRRNGPILVGENHPEILWGSRGQYVQNELGAGGASGIILNGDIVTANMNDALREMDRREWQQRMASRAA